MLRVDGLDVFIQASHILRDVSLAVEPGALVCLVGRNGAGKTTTLRTIMGYLRPTSGRIALQGQDVAGLRPHELAQRGVGFAPEDGGVFGDLTVAENVEIATWTRRTARSAAERIERAYTVFLDQVASPVAHMVARALKAEGLAFTVSTPNGGLRLASDRGRDDYIEFGLHDEGDRASVVGRVRRTRGSRTIEDERPIKADAGPQELTDADVLAFLIHALEPWLER